MLYSDPGLRVRSLDRHPGFPTFVFFLRGKSRYQGGWTHMKPMGRNPFSSSFQLVGKFNYLQRWGRKKHLQFGFGFDFLILFVPHVCTEHSIPDTPSCFLQEELIIECHSQVLSLSPCPMYSTCVCDVCMHTYMQSGTRGECQVSYLTLCLIPWRQDLSLTLMVDCQ